MAKDQLTMKDKSDEEEKLEKQKKKKDSKALSSKARGEEKEGKDSSKKIVIGSLEEREGIIIVVSEPFWWGQRIIYSLNTERSSGCSRCYPTALFLFYYQ